MERTCELLLLFSCENGVWRHSGCVCLQVDGTFSPWGSLCMCRCVSVYVYEYTASGDVDLCGGGGSLGFPGPS